MKPALFLVFAFACALPALAAAEDAPKSRFRVPEDGAFDNGRWSLVGAGGYGTAHTERELFSATRDIWSGAVGFRYQLARLFGMHAGLDVGFSDGETAIYLQVGNAWFRP